MSENLTSRRNFLLILTLGILNALTPLSIDMYLPSFPDIARELGATSSQVALTVSIYFIGFAGGQIFYGPLLDRFGRKKPVYFGLAVYILATFGCMRAHSIEELLFFRFLSATGGCAASVAATAMVRDFFPPADAAKVFSMLMLVLSISPLLAPSLGSFILAFSGWRAIFAVLAVLGLGNTLLMSFALPAGQVADHTVELRWKPIFYNFKQVLMNRQFSTYTVAGAFSFTGLFVYVAASPLIFMDHFHVSARIYGFIFALLAGGMIGGGQLNLFLARHYRPPVIFQQALICQLILAVFFCAGAWFDTYGLIATVAFLFFILLTAGITYPNAAGMALEPFSKNIGSASALLGFIQLGIGAMTSSAIGLVTVKGILPTAMTMSVCSATALAVLTFSKRRHLTAITD
jgi:DHA1 family bicyclomycin/chloramphenicol resistance-like MFS transporter